MKKKKCYYSISVCLLFVCFACNSSHSYTSKYSKKNHQKTYIINSFYIEKYKIYSGGATTCDSYSYYITDSINFRKFIGTGDYCEERLFWDTINSKIIEVYMEYDNIEERKDTVLFFKDTTKIGEYNILELVEENKFE